MNIISRLFTVLSELVQKLLGGIDSLADIFAPPPPQIPPHTKRKMIEYGIGYTELMKAYRSPRTQPGYKPGSTCGVYFGKNLAVGAVYIPDKNNPKSYIIIGCWSRTIGEYYRKFGHVLNQYPRK